MVQKIRFHFKDKCNVNLFLHNKNKKKEARCLIRGCAEIMNKRVVFKIETSVPWHEIKNEGSFEWIRLSQYHELEKNQIVS